MLWVMDPTPEWLDRIQRLRALFLDQDRGERALADYWRSDEDLAAYEGVLAQRIAWKWQAALAEASDRGFSPSGDATVVDFGCGTGIAARCYLQRFGGRRVLLHDRSPKAMHFAVAEIRAAAPGVSAEVCLDMTGISPDVLLVSHVLSELDERGQAQMLQLARRSGSVVAVESGNRQASRRLSLLRAQLGEDFHIVAPCAHDGACPALATEQDWCHFFAAPPPEVFTDGAWVKTARMLGIDLRALPYSFLAVQRNSPLPTRPPGRLLGRPRIGRRAARLLRCQADGLASVVVGKQDKELWRVLRKTPEQLRDLPDGS
jgi:SAM-dependent methyltransferase